MSGATSGVVQEFKIRIMGTTSGESGEKLEPGVSRFSDMIMAAAAVAAGKQKKLSGCSGRVDMVKKIDLSVKLDEDSVDEDEEMESSEPDEDTRSRDQHMASVKDEELASTSIQRSGHENHGFRETTLVLGSQSLVHRSATGSERSTVEYDSPPSSPAGLSASAANQLKKEVTNAYSGRRSHRFNNFQDLLFHFFPRNFVCTDRHSLWNVLPVASGAHRDRTSV